MNKYNYYNLDEKTLKKILDNIHYEIYITDKDLTILYISKNCYEHYGLTQEEMIGKNHNDFVGDYWYPSVLPLVLEEKRHMCISQITKTGKKLISTAIPILDENKDIKFTLSIVQEKVDNLYINLDNFSNQHDEPFLSRTACNLITRSDSMFQLLNLCKKIACSDIPVLIQGESGTGKTILAKYIHEHSSRKGQPFLSLNCAAIPENLLESELFGYAPYAFTDASSKGKPGLISLANNGTLFLDEIGELALPLQAKLLNVVENGYYIPIGGKKEESVNVRIISATNRKLESLIEQKKFREDLYWRLNIIELKIPSLIDRKEDIIPLSNYYLNIFNGRYKDNKTFSPEALETLKNYSWPGNIRQLKNVIERIFILLEKRIITNSDLPQFLFENHKNIEVEEKNDFYTQIESFEKKYIERAFSLHNSSRKLAKALGISQSKANHLINKYMGDNYERIK